MARETLADKVRRLERENEALSREKEEVERKLSSLKEEVVSIWADYSNDVSWCDDGKDEVVARLAEHDVEVTGDFYIKIYLRLGGVSGHDVEHEPQIGASFYDSGSKRLIKSLLIDVFGGDEGSIISDENGDVVIRSWHLPENQPWKVEPRSEIKSD